MDVSVQAGRLESLKSPLAVLPLTEEAVGAIKAGKEKPFDGVARLARSGDFTGEAGEASLLYDPTPNLARLLLVGLGKEKGLDAEKYRRAGSAGAKAARKHKTDTFHVSVRAAGQVTEEVAAVALAEGMLLGEYEFDKYKTEGKKTKSVKEGVLLLGLMSNAVKSAVARAAVVCKNTVFVRDVVNESSEHYFPEDVAKLALQAAKQANVRCTVFDEKQLAKLGCTMILKVGAGSSHPPRMIVLEYLGNPGSKEKVALVGKGITFDSGGLNLKPTGYLETMRLDKSGAVTVLGTIKCLAELRAKVNVVGVMGMAENMIGPDAQKPGDIIKSYHGLTVEVANTDAEGRLVLGDCLAYVEKQHKPTHIVDLATLTGAVLIVLSEYGAGLVSNNDGFAEKLFAAGEKTFERVWRLPLYEEFMEDIKSDIADIKNLGHPKGYGGTLTAAAFLRRFVGETPWIHLDIAGTAWAEKQRFYVPKGATGYGVRLLVEWLAGGK